MAEIYEATLAGTNTQSMVVGRGAKIALQATTPIRYSVSNGASVTVTANDPLVGTGDPYKVDLPPQCNRINVAHQDLATAISVAVYARDP